MNRVAARTSARDDTTRERLLRSGIVLARRGGLRALTVRSLAAHARVNLGSFVYHFGTREAFIAELVERWYSPIWLQLQATVEQELPPVAKLERLILQLVEWASRNRAFLGHLLMDASAGEKAVVRFLRTVAGRHPLLVVQMIRESQAAGQIVRGDPVHLMLFAMSAMGLPVLLAHGAAAGRVFPPATRRFVVGYATDRRHVTERLEWLMTGIRARGAVP